MAERRRLSRWPTTFSCSLDWEGRIIRGIASNLSYGGMRVLEVGYLPPVNSVLTIQLEHESERISLRGRVTYARGISLGIAFEEPRGVLMKRLSKLGLHGSSS